MFNNIEDGVRGSELALRRSAWGGRFFRSHRNRMFVFNVLICHGTCR
jgi:hypothetical protein